MQQLYLTERHLFDVVPYEKVDLKPIYRFIFRKMKENNLDYFYCRAPKEMLDQLFSKLETLAAEAELEKLLSEPDHQKQVLADLEENEKKEGEQLFRQVVAMKPSPVIEAYTDVYGKWPEGYLER